MLYYTRFQRAFKYPDHISSHIAYYLVRTERRRLLELHNRLFSGGFESMHPFGLALTVAFHDARFNADTGDALEKRNTTI